MELQVLISNEFDPYFNLSYENWLLRSIGNCQKVLFLYRNDPSVIVGRFQNPWIECNIKKIEKDGINIVRRQSGGGTVYHDLGNINFTFFSNTKKIDRDNNNKIIIQALNRVGISAYASGGSDLLVNVTEGSRKISGSAFKITRNSSFHHGTLLINADLHKLKSYLKPKDREILQALGIPSVRASVINLETIQAGLDYQKVFESIIFEFFRQYKRKCLIQMVDKRSLIEIEEVKNNYDLLQEWSWIYGECPRFTQKLSNSFCWGDMQVILVVAKGKIQHIDITSDSLHPDIISIIEKSLKGNSFTPCGIVSSIELIRNEIPMVLDYVTEFLNWLSREII